MRVLITGIEGFVGGHLDARLTALGHEVWGTSLEPPARGSARRLACDVREVGAVRSALAASGAEAVVHLAARSSVAESRADPAGTYLTNVGGALSVLEAARLAGLAGPILLVGSAEVYGNPSSAGRIGEDAPPRPLSAYAGSKAAQEAIGGQYARAYGLRVLLTRSFAHTGPGQEPRFALPSFARQLAALERGRARGPLRVGNLSAIRDYLDVRDVTRAYALLLERGEPATPVNVCRGTGFPLREYLAELVELSGVEAEVVEDPALRRELDVEALVGDPSRLEGLGWRPEISTHEMLRDLLTYWRERA